MANGHHTQTVNTVGITCCPKIPIPAFTYTCGVAGDILIFKAVCKPKTALNRFPFLIEIS